MSDRKIISKYYGYDFDPMKLPRWMRAPTRKASNGQARVRMMMPMTVRCNICGEFIYAGTKFNSRKETVRNKRYLGIPILRFYMRCRKCSSEFTICTDPQNMDYKAELGCTRNYEPWKEHKKKFLEAMRKEHKDEEEDVIVALEEKTQQTKREMEDLEHLDELRALKDENESLTTDQLIQYYNTQETQKQDLGAQIELTPEEEASITARFKDELSEQNSVFFSNETSEYYLTSQAVKEVAKSIDQAYMGGRRARALLDQGDDLPNIQLIAKSKKKRKKKSNSALDALASY